MINNQPLIFFFVVVVKYGCIYRIVLEGSDKTIKLYYNKK